jgi:prepilin-type N-terminal cleavage/methylation domain-containing protein
MKLHSQRGFTLLELLIVVVIIGVLAGVAIPQYYVYRERAEISSVMSNCRSLYRAFTIFYLENDYQFPSAPGDGNVDDVDLDTFFPVSDKTWLGGISFEIDINQLRHNLGGNPADRLYVSADGGYQEYYLIMPWGKNPQTQFVVAAADNVTDKDGNLLDGGNWLDGVFIWKNGQLKYQ